MLKISFVIFLLLGFYPVFKIFRPEEKTMTVLFSFPSEQRENFFSAFKN